MNIYECDRLTIELCKFLLLIQMPKPLKDMK